MAKRRLIVPFVPRIKTSVFVVVAFAPSGKTLVFVFVVVCPLHQVEKTLVFFVVVAFVPKWKSCC